MLIFTKMATIKPAQGAVSTRFLVVLSLVVVAGLVALMLTESPQEVSNVTPGGGDPDKASGFPINSSDSTKEPSLAPPPAFLFRTEFDRSEEHTSELQSRENLVCRLLLEKKKKQSDIDQQRNKKKEKVRKIIK